jgi:hypothetical protein
VVTVAVNTQRGNLAKLNPDLVRAMRERYPSDTIAQIAKAFGVDRTTAHYAIHRKTWKNVA